MLIEAGRGDSGGRGRGEHGSGRAMTVDTDLNIRLPARRESLRTAAHLKTLGACTLLLRADTAPQGCADRACKCLSGDFGTHAATRPCFNQAGLQVFCQHDEMQARRPWQTGRLPVIGEWLRISPVRRYSPRSRTKR